MTSGTKGAAQIWDIAAGKPTAVFPKGHSPVWNAAFSNDDRMVITAGTDNTARVWRVSSAQLVYELRGHEARALDAGFSTNGETALTTSDDSTAGTWDVRTGRRPSQSQPGAESALGKAEDCHTEAHDLIGGQEANRGRSEHGGRR